MLFSFFTLYCKRVVCIHIVTAKKGIRSLSLQIDPAWVRRGESIQLFCNYDMEANPLYSVKWYRGTLEFYRYSPFENPPEKTFPFSGIKVDVSIQLFLRYSSFRKSTVFFLFIKKFHINIR